MRVPRPRDVLENFQRMVRRTTTMMGVLKALLLLLVTEVWLAVTGDRWRAD